MIETEVHHQLRAFLRSQSTFNWPHHLTMARLVARALRVGRSALMQIDSAVALKGQHRLSYLTPALLWPEPAILVLPERLYARVLHQDIPLLQQQLPVVKPVHFGDAWPQQDFRGLLVTSLDAWLANRSNFPEGIPALIDGASELESAIRAHLRATLSAAAWEALMLAYPHQQTRIRDLRVQLTHSLFRHPANPYSCHLIDTPEAALLNELYQTLTSAAGEERMPQSWRAFWRWFSQPEHLAWGQLDRDAGSVTLHSAPMDLADLLSDLWSAGPVVIMGAALDAHPKAERYRARLGLGDMTCLNFGPDRHHDGIQLYLPDKLPMPNTSQFQTALLQEIRTLLAIRFDGVNPDTCLTSEPEQSGYLEHQTHWPRSAVEAAPTVVLIGDVPLRAKFASILAAEFGSRVQMEAPIGLNGVLITGWDYWQAHQDSLPPPGLMIIATLPIPSLENPLVAARVAAFKRRRQDWFKAYLLPETLSQLQRAIAPVRQRPSELPGTVALLDNRVNHRSYGRQILAALDPAARSSYLDPSWFHERYAADGDASSDSKTLNK